MSRFDRIIIHHSLTKDSGSVSWQAIRRHHIETNGWSDIGYHFGIELVGAEFEILVGRPLDRAGAHTIGENGRAIGVCCVGNFDPAPPPKEMIDRLVRFCTALCRQLAIDRNMIFGHCHFAAKSCPGEKFPLDEVRERLLNSP